MGRLRGVEFSRTGRCGGLMGNHRSVALLFIDKTSLHLQDTQSFLNPASKSDVGECIQPKIASVVPRTGVR